MSDLRLILRRSLDAKAIRVEKIDAQTVGIRPPEGSAVANRLAVVRVRDGKWTAASGESGLGWFSLARFLDLDFQVTTEMVAGMVE